MTRVLITGMSGTGKSTALAELARRGHRVVDANLSAWSIEVASPAGSGSRQLWREDAMDALLAQHVTGWLFVAGCASNQASFYDRFDAVELLSVPREVMLQRIATRTPPAKALTSSNASWRISKLWSHFCGQPRRRRL
jgi:predicted ATPase